MIECQTCEEILELLTLLGDHHIELELFKAADVSIKSALNALHIQESEISLGMHCLLRASGNPDCFSSLLAPLIDARYLQIYSGGERPVVRVITTKAATPQAIHDYVVLLVASSWRMGIDPAMMMLRRRIICHFVDVDELVGFVNFLSPAGQSVAFDVIRQVFVDENRLDEARLLATKVRTIRKSIYGKFDDRTIQAADVLIEIYHLQGKDSKVIQWTHFVKSCRNDIDYQPMALGSRVLAELLGTCDDGEDQEIMTTTLLLILRPYEYVIGQVVAFILELYAAQVGDGSDRDEMLYLSNRVRFQVLATQELIQEQGCPPDLALECYDGSSYEGMLRSAEDVLKLLLSSCQGLSEQDSMINMIVHFLMPYDALLQDITRLLLTLHMEQHGSNQEQEQMLVHTMLMQDLILVVQTAIYSDDHPKVLATMIEKASISSCQEKWSEARLLEERVLKAQFEILGLNHYDTITTFVNLGVTLCFVQDLQSAKAMLNIALRLRMQTCGPDHPATQQIYQMIAFAEEIEMPGVERMVEQSTFQKSTASDHLMPSLSPQKCSVDRSPDAEEHLSDFPGQNDE